MISSPVAARMPDTHSADELRYLPLAPEHAEALVACIREVYGDTYSLPEFYHPERIRGLIGQDLLHAFAAWNDRDEIVGVLCSQLECPGAITIDGRTGMVKQAYRQHGVLKTLGERMLDIYLRPRIHGIQMYPVTFHTISQHKALNSGAFVTGLLPAHFSCATIPPGYRRFHGRVGVVSFYYVLQPLPPQAVCLPAEYRDVIAGIYAGPRIERHALAPRDTAASPATHFVSTRNEHTCVATLIVDTIGPEFGAALSVAVETCAHQGDDVIYLDIPLTLADNGIAVAAARGQGFFFGALLPARQRGDTLRLQRYEPSTVLPEEMELASAEIAAMRDRVLDDARHIQARRI